MANVTRKPMRQGQQNRRGRGRNRKPQNPLSRNLESNGPDVKIRGTASHIAEKYATLARDALSSGDNVAGESYLQHAEHYNRIIMANQAQQGDGANGSGAGRGRSNGSGEGADTAQPEVAPEAAAGSNSAEAAPNANSTVAAPSTNSAEAAGDDDGLARTMARTTKLSGNSSDEENQADRADGPAKKDAPEKSSADETPDEAVN